MSKIKEIKIENGVKVIVYKTRKLRKERKERNSRAIRRQRQSKIINNVFKKVSQG